MSNTLRLLPIPRELERLSGNCTTAVEPECILNPQAELPAEGYALSIDTDGVRIQASAERGLAHGRQTLEQIRRQSSNGLPCLKIRDWPDFAVRGYMLDISRNRVPTQSSLLELVTTLAALRINQLQLYTEHTFAYPSHPEVWENASPLSPDEIRELDEACAMSGIELVPNQQSFGHMERWLRHADYRHLAEVEPTEQQASCLAPDAQSRDFMRLLYKELLPCFGSRRINIGCDETFELGQGRSRDECEQRGRGRVYLDYLLGLIEDLHAQGYEVQFWGDIVRAHRELVAELPERSVTALCWGYEAPQDPSLLPEAVRQGMSHFGFDPESLRGFGWHVAPFVEAGLPFVVCPGTSSWNALLGRLPNALGNLLDAVQVGLSEGADGVLITDWGDNGHLQPPCVSLPPLIYGAAVSWCAAANQDLDLEGALADVLGDSELAGPLARLGSVYRAPGLSALNASPLALALLSPAGEGLRVWGETNAELMQVTHSILGAEGERVAAASPASERARIAQQELIQGIGLARHGAWRLERRFLESGPGNAELKRDLEELIERQSQAWSLRSRPGGLDDSLARLHKILAEYA